MASLQKHQQPHFLMIPVMAQGHMIPMMDMAKLLAQRGAVITFITTPLNATRLRTTVDRTVNSSDLQIRLVELRFPCLEAGLPNGCENIDMIPFAADMKKKFFVAIEMLQQPVEKLLQEHEHPLPSCMISDMSISWTSEIAQKFCIPRLVFHGTSSFSLLCSYNVRHCNAHESVGSESEPFLIPGLPHRIEITKAQLPSSFVTNSDMKHLYDKIRKAESSADGVVLNSFDELEMEYADMYRKATGKRTWSVGPVSLCNKETLDKVNRGNKTSINEDQCLSWLNSRSPKSVIYVCFGSMCPLSTAQLIEIGLGLEALNRSFIWTIKSGKKLAEIDQWLSEEFEERIKDRGLIIRGWAPQILILSHPSTGGFLTHCGWNSTSEAICAGLPMITWPLFAEQFLNEKMIVNILEIGVSVGVKMGIKWGTGQEEDAVEAVKMEEIRKVIERLMDEGEEGEMRRKRAREFGVKAKRAMEEGGGSSYINMTHLIEDAMELSNICLAKKQSADEFKLQREANNSTNGC
eukprot:TRINITY_DN12314_c0_g1_i5.p1 TRINITY_DN12314_c0_g1~~TRINITY_DN12314_c0_g1_i5.p1  ORF type:complete len:520 (+),score=92.47 TRINITY_DN12314_c0_g1_i5:73-1632(+)